MYIVDVYYMKLSWYNSTVICSTLGKINSLNCEAQELNMGQKTFKRICQEIRLLLYIMACLVNSALAISVPTAPTTSNTEGTQMLIHLRPIICIYSGYENITHIYYTSVYTCIY